MIEGLIAQALLQNQIQILNCSYFQRILRIQGTSRQIFLTCEGRRNLTVKKRRRLDRLTAKVFQSCASWRISPKNEPEIRSVENLITGWMAYIQYRGWKGGVACLRLERATLSLSLSLCDTGTTLLGKRGGRLATRKITLTENRFGKPKPSRIFEQKYCSIHNNYLIIWIGITVDNSFLFIYLL